MNKSVVICLIISIIMISVSLSSLILSNRLDNINVRLNNMKQELCEVKEQQCTQYWSLVDLAQIVVPELEYAPYNDDTAPDFPKFDPHINLQNLIDRNRGILEKK